MVKQQNKSSLPVGVAMDVAKRCNEVLIEHPDRVRCQRWSVLNTREAHGRRVAHLQAFERPVTIGFEATGNYHRPLVGRKVAKRRLCNDIYETARESMACPTTQI